MIREVQSISSPGCRISDKHIEVLVRQMLKKIRIEDNGDTEFLPGTLVDVLEFGEVNENLERRKETGRRKADNAWYYQSFSGNRFLPVSGILPGDNKSP